MDGYCWVRKDAWQAALGDGPLGRGRLSLSALGVLAYLCAQDGDQVPLVEELAAHSPDSVETVQAALRELVDAGYVVRQRSE